MRYISVFASFTNFAGFAVSFPLFTSGLGTIDPAFKCPQEDIISTKCAGPYDCLYANPNNCGTYIECEVDPGERTGTPHLKPCPSGLKWNDSIKKCDFLV
jgi:hypothetical protein